jgi:hypothetical protein
LVFILDDDGNINPYATFKEMKQALRDTEPSEMDDISLEKAEAQRAVSLCRMIRFKSIMYFNLFILHCWKIQSSILSAEYTHLNCWNIQSSILSAEYTHLNSDSNFVLSFLCCLMIFSFTF